MLIGGRFAEPAGFEIAAAAAGAVLLAAAQLWNIKLAPRCDSPGHAHGGS